MNIEHDIKELLPLVKKYDRSGPRYTSYPTVPVWTKEYTPDDYKAAVNEASKNSEEPISIYLHIPFCRRRCWYCGCNTTVGCSDGTVEEYLSHIKKESDIIFNLLRRRNKLSQLHWGGGTPTYLTDEQTVDTLRLFSAKLEFQGNAEIAIELDPRTTTPERITLLKSLGFNRLSFGVQDFNADVQKAIGRNQDEKETVELYDHCRREGFERINFDLIYGLPRQNLKRMEQTVQKTIKLRPDRIALYSFAHLPDVMPHQKNINTADLPRAETKFRLFYAARRMFLEAGYYQIGMDHFVLPDDELAEAARTGKLRRNFMGYTVESASDWIGFGMSAISYINNNFAQNISHIDKYNRAVDDTGIATYRGLKLSDDDTIRQFIISELMCNFVVDFKRLQKRFNLDYREYFKPELSRLDSFIADGLIQFENDAIKVTGPGKIFIRNIAMLFDAYLKPESRRKPKAKFSRTI